MSSDIEDLLVYIWKQKLRLSLLVLISCAASGIFYLNSETESYSKIKISVLTLPVYMPSHLVITDFENTFFSKQSFDNWKQTRTNTSIKYLDISNVSLQKPVVMLKRDSQRLIVFNRLSDKQALLTVRSGSLTTVGEVWDYASYVSDSLQARYIRGQGSYNDLLRELYSNKELETERMGEILAHAASFMTQLTHGLKAVNISPPTELESSKISFFNLMTFAVFLGLGVGLFLSCMGFALRKMPET
ncbi:hypothetical protein N9I75_01945 [Alphaproteobacteria bacterium]|nr:hypothetical protein [Alphaproteobacteria bacterium]